MNTQWRMNDFVYFRKCSRCNIRAEWQHNIRDENTIANFEKILTKDGWKRTWFFGWRWVCPHHRKHSSYMGVS